MERRKPLAIDGSKIGDIPSFYVEINRVFMADVGWPLAPSLDALNDMLYGVYGAIEGDEPVALIWTEFEKNRRDLGVEITRQIYLDKLQHPQQYNLDGVKNSLAALENGTGKTYFEIVLEITGGHANIELIPRG